MSEAIHLPDLTLEEYHRRDEWSHSQMEVLLASPPLFYGRFITGVFPRESTDAMDDGSIVHAVLAGEAEVEDLVAIIPSEVLSADGARKGTAWKDWSAANAGKIQRKREECDSLFMMVESVRSHPKARWLLDSEGEHEFSMAWKDDDTGLLLRERPDRLARLVGGDTILCDIKTTRATDHHRFASDIVKYGYHRQAAWYIDGAVEFGIKVAGFCFITVDKTPAHESHVYELAPPAIEKGRQENRELLRELAHRLEHNQWGSRDEGAIVEIDLPTRAYNTNHEWRIAS